MDTFIGMGIMNLRVGKNTDIQEGLLRRNSPQNLKKGCECMSNLMELDVKMTSLEIAEITGKRHDNILLDIRKEISNLGEEIGLLIFKESTYTNSQNKTQPCYEFGRKGAMQLALKYDAKTRYRVIERIEELEELSRQPKAVTEYLNMTEEERGIAFFSEVKHRKQLQQKLEESQPKIEAYDTFMDNDNLQSLSDVAKALDYGPIKFCEFLRNEKVLFKRGGVNLPYQQYLDKEYFDVKEVPGKGKNVLQTKVTPKGVEFISRLIKRRSPVKLTFIREFHHPRTTK